MIATLSKFKLCCWNFRESFSPGVFLICSCLNLSRGSQIQLQRPSCANICHSPLPSSLIQFAAQLQIHTDKNSGPVWEPSVHGTADSWKRVGGGLSHLARYQSWCKRLMSMGSGQTGRLLRSLGHQAIRVWTQRQEKLCKIKLANPRPGPACGLLLPVTAL